jgi:RHS repeat-associated protein
MLGNITGMSTSSATSTYTYAKRSGGGVTSYGYDHTGQRVFKATGTATTSYPNKYFNTEGATTTKHFFTPDGALLAVVSTSTEGEGEGLGEGMGLLGDSLDQTVMTSEETSSSVLPLLEGKTAVERADIKSAAIAKFGPITRTSRGKYDIEIVSINAIDGGVEVFARAWNAEGQLGFGEDGTVDIERFRIFNPPVLVPDANGPILQEWEEEQPNGSFVKRSRTLREDPGEALLQVLEHNLSVMKNVHNDTQIIPGKIGRTTSTFYGSSGDGRSCTINSYPTWGSARNASEGNATSYSAVGLQIGAEEEPGASYAVCRAFIPFDTSALPDSATIAGATLSVVKYDGTNPQTSGLIQTSQPSTSTLTDDDFDALTLNSPAEGTSDRVDTNASNGSAISYTLNTTGIGWLSKTGWTKLGIRYTGDIDNVTPPTDVRRYVMVYSSDQAGTTQDPTLVVEHGASNPSMRFIHTDHLGGTNVVTDNTGGVVQTLDYYPYGSQRIASGSHSEQRRFIGEEYDGDTEFSYLNARYYQGSRGQFMSQDPVFWEIGLTENGRSIITDPQLVNAYGYARSNPLVYFDRKGEQSISIQGGYAGPVPGSAAPTGPIYGYIFALNGIYQTKGITFAARPGPQGSVSLSPGGVSEGRVTEFSASGGSLMGGQIGAQETYGVGRTSTGGVGVGLPGAGLSVYDVKYLMGYPELFSTLGGPLRYETTRSSLQPRSFVSQPSVSNTYIWPSAPKDRGTALSSGSSGSYASASSYGLQANSGITSHNIGAFINFVLQFIK